jgi:hypothetical protein
LARHPRRDTQNRSNDKAPLLTNKLISILQTARLFRAWTPGASAIVNATADQTKICRHPRASGDDQAFLFECSRVNLAELRRLGRFGQAKLLGTFDATPKGRHYMG